MRLVVLVHVVPSCIHVVPFQRSANMVCALQADPAAAANRLTLTAETRFYVQASYTNPTNPCEHAC